MNDNLFLIVAIVVFSLMFVGLVLTIFEFRNGEPRDQQRKAERDRND